jgi:hypothetical protein
LVVIRSFSKAFDCFELMNEKFYFPRFLALPSLLHAPRDHDRQRRNLPRRRLYEVEPEVLGSRHIMWTPVALDLDFSEDYRRDLALAFSEVYLVRENAAVISLMQHVPLRYLRDPGRIQRARMACNGQDPVQMHLNPLLQQLGRPLM